MEQKIKHLEMIQSVITRMATNSFMIKGWSVTLVTALFALASKDTNHKYVLISYVPAIIFWFLDGYFLSQEKLFRALFNSVRLSNKQDSDFSMDTRGLGETKDTWPYPAFSKTLLPFHGAILGSILLVMFLLR